MPMQFVACMDIGDMHFENRSLECLYGIDDGDGGERIGRRIDDDGVRTLPCRLDQVDQFALLVRLVKGKRMRDYSRPRAITK
jgi:hypothetical protein